MSTVALRPFEAPDLLQVLPWFAHPDQREFARDLPVRELDLRRTMPGTEHRGARVLARHAWVVDDEAGVPVAFVGAEIYDRAPFLDARGRPNRPAPTWQGSIAGLMLCVDPARWVQGYGCATLLAVAAADELEGVDWLAAGIQRGHLASERCVARAGFIPAASAPDQEGMVDWIHKPLR